MKIRKKNFYVNTVDVDGKSEMQLQLHYEMGKLCFSEDTTIALLTKPGSLIIVDAEHDEMQRVELAEKRLKK